MKIWEVLEKEIIEIKDRMKPYFPLANLHYLNYPSPYRRGLFEKEVK